MCSAPSRDMAGFVLLQHRAQTVDQQIEELKLEVHRKHFQEFRKLYLTLGVFASWVSVSFNASCVASCIDFLFGFITFTKAIPNARTTGHGNPAQMMTESSLFHWVGKRFERCKSLALNGRNKAVPRRPTHPWQGS